MKRIVCLLLVAGLCASLAACGGAQPSSESESGLESSASVEQSAPTSSPDPSEQPEQDLPMGIPPASAGILREMRTLGPEGIVVADDQVEASGGSLVAEADNELIELIGEVITREWQQTQLPEPGYLEFVKVRAAGSGSWSILLFREEDSGDCYLRLTDVYGGEPTCYRVEDESLDLLRDAIQSRSDMIEAPVEEFLAPVQIVVAHYRSGSYDADEYAAIYEKPPQGAVIPAVNSVEDFTVVPGRDLAPYHVIFPIQGVRYNMVLAMIQVYPPADQQQIPSWRVMTVTFQPTGV